MSTDLIERTWPLLGQATGVTLLLGISSFLIGSVIGLGVTLARLSKFRLLRYLAVIYVSIVRGTPLLIQILLTSVFLKWAWCCRRSQPRSLPCR